MGTQSKRRGRNKRRGNGRNRDRTAGKALGTVQSRHGNAGGTQARPIGGEPWSPEEILHALGLYPVDRDEAYWKQYIALIRKAGGSLEAESDAPNTREQYDRLMISEEAALHFHRGDYRGSLQSMSDLDRCGILPVAPKRIADLGGGVGMFSMWLAGKYPSSQVTVYDSSENALKWGRKWSQKLGLTNITYVQKSYQEIAEAQPTHDCDLVLMYFGYRGDPLPEPGDPFLGYEATASTSCDVTSLHVAKAISNLLGPDGVAYVKTGWTEQGLRQFFEAVRSTRLGIDWSKTIAPAEPSQDPLCGGSIHVALCQDHPRVAGSAWEEARAFCATITLGSGPMYLGGPLLESFSNLFADGKVLLRIEGLLPQDSRIVHRVRVIQKSGLILFEVTSPLGLRKGAVFSLGRIDAVLYNAAFMARVEMASSPRHAEVIDPTIKALWDKHVAGMPSDLMQRVVGTQLVTGPTGASSGFDVKDLTGWPTFDGA